MRRYNWTVPAAWVLSRGNQCAKAVDRAGKAAVSAKKFEISPRRRQLFWTFAPTPHPVSIAPANMAKRAADTEQDQEAIKNGDRPMEIDQDEAGEFEDEFEDEFESEDEIFEAGVDGRPDEEREAEEKESTTCPQDMFRQSLTCRRWHGSRTE